MGSASDNAWHRLSSSGRWRMILTLCACDSKNGVYSRVEEGETAGPDFSQEAVAVGQARGSKGFPLSGQEGTAEGRETAARGGGRATLRWWWGCVQQRPQRALSWETVVPAQNWGSCRLVGRDEKFGSHLC